MLCRWEKKVNVCLFQEYSRYLAKVEKYREKERTGPNVVKLDAVSLYLFMPIIPPGT